MRSATIQQDKRFDLLDDGVQKIIRSLLETKQVSRQDMDTGFKKPSMDFLVSHSGSTYQEEERCKRVVELSLLESLRFETMEHRHDSIPEAHQRTFEWIFSDPKWEGRVWSDFAEWLRSGSEIYWINGKAGSGKSTLMRYIVEDSRTRKNLEYWAQGDVVELPSFYFWNSGATEQRSQSGLLRTMLCQILEQHPGLIPAVFPDEWNMKVAHAKYSMPINFGSWSLTQLRKSFTHLIQRTSEDLRLCVFIDGFDEFDGDHESLAEYLLGLSTFPSVKFCISSRPWQVFIEMFKDWPSLRLQDLTHDDIKLYIEDKLGSDERMKRLSAPALFQIEIDELVKEVTRKADGVFLWVTLVIKSLLRGFRNRDRLSDLMQRLGELPRDLEPLYSHMLSSIEPVYIEDALKTFQLLRIVKGFGLTLRSEELYLALTTNLARVLINSETDLELAQSESIPLWDRNQGQQIYHSIYNLAALDEYMSIWLRTRCGGLLEISHGCVSYIHRTARDFLEQDKLLIEGSGSTLLASRMRYDPWTALGISKTLILKRNMFDSPSDILPFPAKLRPAHWYARGMHPSNSDILMRLLDECDKILSMHQLKVSTKRPDRIESDLHWSNLRWPRTWKTDFLCYAVENHLPEYVKAKLASNPYLLKSKSGIPLLAFCFLSVDLNDVFDLSTLEFIEILLEQGADPNELFEGHSVWQYWVHFVHVLVHRNSDWYIGHALSRLEKIFRLLLRSRVDLSVCCFQYSRIWESVYNIEGINGDLDTSLRKRRSALAIHGEAVRRSNTNEVRSPLLADNMEQLRKEHHSLAAVIKDVFNTQDKPEGANELLRLLTKLEANDHYPRA